MVQPKYSPEEALQKIKLMMMYDSSKTLNENKQLVSEQYTSPAIAGATTGAALGGLAAGTGLVAGSLTAPVTSMAGLAATLGLKMGFIGPAAGTAGFAALGGLIGLGALPLAYWAITKDTGSEAVKKYFQMCSTTPQISKLPRKIDDSKIRELSDNINDAVNHKTLGFLAGTDEEKLFGQFNALQDGTASDFCALVNAYNKNYGDLWDDLDSDIDSEDEWKQIFRPIRNCVDDSLKTVAEETIEDCKQNPDQEKCKGGKPTNDKKFPPCTAGSYKLGCSSDKIKQLQACLGNLVDDGKWGDKTQQRLLAVHSEYKQNPVLTDADIDKICKKTTPITPPQPQASVGGEEEIISFGADF